MTDLQSTLPKHTQIYTFAEKSFSKDVDLLNGLEFLMRERETESMSRNDSESDHCLDIESYLEYESGDIFKRIKHSFTESQLKILDSINRTELSTRYPSKK